MQNKLQSTRISSGFAGIELTGLKSSACSKLQPLQHFFINNPVINEISNAPQSCSDMHLHLNAVINERKGVSDLTEVTGAKNKITLSMNIAPPSNQT
jgi:hypothetical protein